MWVKRVTHSGQRTGVVRFPEEEMEISECPFGIPPLTIGQVKLPKS